jgi:pyridoxine 5'-phosphate synthase PdxJ
LGDTYLTDADLKELARMKSLRELELGDTKITEAGVAELQKALPNFKRRCRSAKSNTTPRTNP